MAVIHVPRPKNAYDPGRPLGSLLKAQVDHLREAESKLPLRYRREIDIYVKAVKTEGEAAAYIRRVTEAIHDAHADAERARRVPKPKRVMENAVAEERTRGNQKGTRKPSARKPGTSKPKKRASSMARTK
jgi:hypothetical protein